MVSQTHLVEVVVVVHVLGTPSQHGASTCELALAVGLRLAPDGVPEVVSMRAWATGRRMNPDSDS